MIQIEPNKIERLYDFHRRLVDRHNRTGQVCFGEFNGHTVFSSDTIDQAYMNVIGRSYTEFCSYEKLLEEYHHFPGLCDYLSKMFNTGTLSDWLNAKKEVREWGC